MTEQEEKDLELQNQQNPEGPQEPEEQPEAPKADQLKEIQELGIIDDAEEWDNLKISQIKHLKSAFEGRSSTEDEVVKRRRAEQALSDLKRKVSAALTTLQESFK